MINKKDNWYLTGRLLGYADKDIELLYILNSPEFKDWWKTASNTNPPYAKTFANWPQEDKKRFQEFETTIWPISESYADFITDKNNTIQWIQEHQNIPAEELITLPL